ncbi:MAG: glycerophosphodiester phosphodiesterase, partial [Planctomycetota bacterium]
MLISPFLFLLCAIAQDPQTAQDAQKAVMQESSPIKARHTELSRRLADRAKDHPLVVAHRGEPVDFPENTMPAFESALAVGSHMIELDFRQTKDGALIVIHDKTLDRTTDGEDRLGGKDLKVTDYDLEQLSSLDAGTWKHSKHHGVRIPTLEAALERIQEDSITMIEHK